MNLATGSKSAWQLKKQRFTLNQEMNYEVHASEQVTERVS
jgi:hypothetical protein